MRSNLIARSWVAWPLVFIAVIFACSISPAHALDPKAFSLTFPEEFLTLVLGKAVRDAQVKIRGRTQRLPIDDITVTFEPGRKLTFTLRTDIESVRELARAESGTVARALNRFLDRASAEYSLLFRFMGKLSVVPPVALGGGAEHVHDAALAIDFDQSDIALELHKGGSRTASAPGGLERLGLWLLDRHLRKIPVAESLEITTQLNRTWGGYVLASKGHRIVARFLFARFPFVPFTLDSDGPVTDDHALRLIGHRE